MRKKFRYDEFGNPAEGADAFLFRYTGQKYEAELGLYYYKARFYDPEAGRFLAPDPIGYGDGMNMYAYVGNDPVNGTDPSGLSRVSNNFTRVVCFTESCGFSGGSSSGSSSGGTGGFVPTDDIAFTNAGCVFCGAAPSGLPSTVNSGSIASTLANFAIGVGQGVLQLAYDTLIASDAGPYPTGLGVLFGAQPGANLFGDSSSLANATGRITGSLGGLIIPGARGGAIRPITRFEVGTFADLQRRSVRGDGLDIHHAVQVHPANQIIDGFSRSRGAAIALPRSVHTQIPNLRGQFTGSARDLLARDIGNLRNVPGGPPNRSLQQLIDLNRQQFPGAF